jgi:hypothetical protein
MKTILSIARRYASVEGWGDLEDRTSASAINLRADVASALGKRRPFLLV